MRALTVLVSSLSEVRTRAPFQHLPFFELTTFCVSIFAVAGLQLLKRFLAVARSSTESEFDRASEDLLRCGEQQRDRQLLQWISSLVNSEALWFGHWSDFHVREFSIKVLLLLY